MYALNSVSLGRIEQQSRARVEATTAGDVSANAALADSLEEAKTQASSACMLASPVSAPIRSIVSNVQTYAAAVSGFPGAISGAMLQALSDVSVLARLGLKDGATSDDIRGAARGMLVDGRERAKATKDENLRIATLSQSMSDARAAAALDPQIDTSDIVPRFIGLANAQQVPANRVKILASGVKTLAGVISSRPQVVDRQRSATTSPGGLAALPPERRREFNALWSRFEASAVRIPRRSETESYAVKDALVKLLKSGALDQKDSTGVDLLTNLTALGRQEMAPGLDRDLVLAQTIVHTAFPGRSMSQGMHLTCAAATVSYQVATKRPSDYTRIVAGLTSPAGKATLPSGAVASRVDDSVQEEGCGRSLVERVVQSSLMNVGGSAYGGRYQNQVDGFVHEGNKQLTQTGMYPAQLAKLEEAVGEGKWVAVDRPTREGILAALQTPEAVPFTLKWSAEEDHWVLARGIDQDRVYFRNPHGYRRSDTTTLAGVDHRLHEDGIESLPVDDFVRLTKNFLRRP